MASKDTEKETVIITDSKSLADAMQLLAGLKPSKDNPYILTLTQEGEARRSKQNRLAFKWYNELGAFTGHGRDYERAVCKLHIGVPLMREDKDFNEFYTAAVLRLTYEQKLAAMEYIPVTRLMTVKRFAHYLTEIDQKSANDGYQLSHPDDLYWAALMMEHMK